MPLGKTTFQITTSVGNSLHTYDLRRGLNLVFLSRPSCPKPITATYAYRDRVFVAWGGLHSNESRGLWVFKRGRLVEELDTRDTTHQSIKQILVFGSWVIACGSEAIEVWKADSYEHYTTILPTGQSAAQHTRNVFSGLVCTLPTFLNKIFVGRHDGLVEIYNVSTGKLIHTILSPSATSGSITALTPALALGLLAIAYADASVCIYDVEADEPVLNLQQKNTTKPVTSITFRSDGLGAGEDGRLDGVMATASVESGDVALWDLNRGGRLTGVLRSAHETSNMTTRTGVTKIEFLPGQPVLISSGRDNALRSWTFDQMPFSPIPRILHSRSGHASTITKLKFLPAASDGSDAAGKWLLSAAHDRSLWGFSLRKDGQNTELSQGAVKAKARKTGANVDDGPGVESFKAPPIIDIACSLNRDGGMGSVNGRIWTNSKGSNAEESSMTGWESVVTAHADDRFARTWSWGRKQAGRWAFETSDRQPVTSVAVTICGTFAIVGSAAGAIDMYNLQSGAHRQRYPPKLSPAQAKHLKSANAQVNQVSIPARGHTDAITGIVTDNLNRVMVSTSSDCTMTFWDFSTGRILQKKSFDSIVPLAIRYNAVSGLLALSCDDLCIRIIDIETRKTVRELWGCRGQIYDFCFSHDGHWIVACSMDSVVRVFDLATGHLIDAFKTETCTNAAFSSTGEFLATAHAGSTGIHIWSNKALFTHIATKQIDPVGGIIDLSDTAEFQAASQLAIAGGPEQNDELDDEAINSDVDQLDKSLLTLSLVPQSRWQTLLNLESIRQRNKPIQPPEKPKAAPFFLGSTLTNGQASTQAIAEETTIDESERSRISRLALTSQSNGQSQLTTLLSDFDTTINHNPMPICDYMTSLPPSAADLEIRSLSVEEMPIFIHALTEQLHLRKSFELVNTWMSVFLKLHGDIISEVDEVNDAVLSWRRAMEAEEKRLAQLVGYTRGVVEFLRSAR